MKFVCLQPAATVSEPKTRGWLAGNYTYTLNLAKDKVKLKNHIGDPSIIVLLKLTPIPTIISHGFFFFCLLNFHTLLIMFYFKDLNIKNHKYWFKLTVLSLFMQIWGGFMEKLNFTEYNLKVVLRRGTGTCTHKNVL